MMIPAMQYVQELSVSGEILPISPCVRQISAELLRKYGDQIRVVLSTLRKVVDVKVMGLLRRDIQANIPGARHRLKTYPEGRCLYIRDAVLSVLQSCPDILGIPDIMRNVFHPIWCINRDRSTQNAIQLGDIVLDVARDTGSIATGVDPILVSLVRDSGLRNPRNYADLVAILESYYGIEAFPNVYLPRLAPFIPVIFVDKNGRPGFTHHVKRFDAKNVLAGLSDASRFIFESQFADRRLDRKTERRLHQIARAASGKDPNLGPVASSPEQAGDMLMQIRGRSHTAAELSEVYVYYFDAIRESGLNFDRGYT